MNVWLAQLGRRFLPKPVRRKLLRWSRWPPVGAVDFGDLRRTRPISEVWGGDRGLALDRYYIEGFLRSRADDIRGRVLEVGDDSYTKRFGRDRVTRSEIVHAAEGNPKATFVADFSDAPSLPSEAFNCVICTQTLHLIPEISAAIRTIHRILSPEGVLLATFPGISQLYVDPEGRWHDHWRLTSASASSLFEPVFGTGRLTISTFGNVLAAAGFLYGLAAEELSEEELDEVDPRYEMLVAVRALKTDESA